MSTVINTNTVANNTVNIYNRNNALMNGALTRLATSQKINSAKDGASMYAISERMRDRMRANDQANQNSQTDAAMLKTAQDGLAKTLDVLTTMRERAINSANDANVNLDRSAIVTEIKNLTAQIDYNANSTKFNGRALLNGAVDSSAVPTASKTSTTEAKAAETVTASNIGTIAPNVVNVTGTTNMDQGTASVFRIDLKKFNATNTMAEPIAAAGSDALTDLVKPGATADTDTIFAKGNKITFSYKVDGEEKNFTYEVKVGDKVSDLVTALKNSDTSGLANVAVLAADANITNGSANITTADSKDLKATVGGLYIVGASDKAITDFQIAVTETVNNKQVTKLTSQNAVEPVGVMKYQGDTSKGTNSVYTLGSGINGNTGDNTRLMDLKDNNNAKILQNGEADDTITFNVDGKEVSVTGESTIADLNAAFANNGINIRAHLYDATDDANVNVQYDGQTVTKGTNGGAVNFKVSGLTGGGGLAFVTAEGEAINNLTISAKSTDGTNRTFAINGLTLNDTTNEKITTADLTRELALDPDKYSSASTSSSASAVTPALLPQGSKLTFFVGGESNFGINFTIGKATSENLLGMSADNFANMFGTSENAQKALGVIDTAMTKALNEQTRLGSMEARMGYISENLTAMNTNLEAADSVMRDTDEAKEMTNFMKYMALSQASQYMLAQASQNAFSVLQLLQP